METTKIVVKVIDYYHRDKEMNLIPDQLPKRLNYNSRFLDNPKFKVPLLNLNKEVTDSGAGELKMESLLEYIRQKGWLNGEKPNFVTNKQLLKCIASGDFYKIEIQCVKLGNVIFMLKSSEDNCNVPFHFGKIFEHFMTKTAGDAVIKEDENVRKAVFVAEISNNIGTDGKFKVMYSGEIDAIDGLNQHYELKVLCGGINEYFWKNKSCSCYWQSIFSNVPTIIVGSRTGKRPNDPKTRAPLLLPEYSLYNIKKLNVRTMPMKAANNWKVAKCEEKLQEFLQSVSKMVTKNGDCFVFSKTKADDPWTIVDVEQKDSPFFLFVSGLIDNKMTPPLEPKSESESDENQSLCVENTSTFLKMQKTRKELKLSDRMLFIDAFRRTNINNY